MSKREWLGLYTVEPLINDTLLEGCKTHFEVPTIHILANFNL